jgi:hypothetical protein
MSPVTSVDGGVEVWRLSRVLGAGPLPATVSGFDGSPRSSHSLCSTDSLSSSGNGAPGPTSSTLLRRHTGPDVHALHETD